MAVCPTEVHTVGFEFDCMKSAVLFHRRGRRDCIATCGCEHRWLYSPDAGSEDFRALCSYSRIRIRLYERLWLVPPSSIQYPPEFGVIAFEIAVVKLQQRNRDISLCASYSRIRIRLYEGAWLILTSSCASYSRIRIRLYEGAWLILTSSITIPS